MLDLLFQRGPAIGASWNGYYGAMRFDLGVKRESLIFERSDTPWRDLSAAWKLTSRSSLTAGGSNLMAEGESVTFPLEAIDEVIVAAKTCLYSICSKNWMTVAILN